jgi:hypothetical protein
MRFGPIRWHIMSITGLIFFTIEKICGFASNPRMGGGLIVAVIFFLAYWHSVRGGLYLRKAKKATAAPLPQVLT